MYSRTIIALSFSLLVLSFSAAQAEDTKRSFYMGITPQLHDWSWKPDVVEKNAQYISGIIHQHSDIIVQHIDNGVPWPEIAENTPWHEKVRQEINWRLAHSKRAPNKKLYLSLSLLNGGRNGVAGYWEEETNTSLPWSWKFASFDDEKVINTFLQYCRIMIDTFEPDYFAYAIETNMLITHAPDKVDAFIRAMKVVYSTLKKEYPDMPVFITLHADHMRYGGEKHMAIVKRMLPYTDYFALSTYPYFVPDVKHKLDPKTLVQKQLEDIEHLMGNKPLVIAETGFTAEQFEAPSLKLTYPGTQKLQAIYMDTLLKEAQKRNAVMVVYYQAQDLDAFVHTLKTLGAEDAVVEFVSWFKDIGLIDGEGNKRQALTIWDYWFQKTRKGMAQ